MVSAPLILSMFVPLQLVQQQLDLLGNLKENILLIQRRIVYPKIDPCVSSISVVLDWVAETERAGGARINKNGACPALKETIMLRG